MGRKPTGNPVGRPILTIDWNKVEQYLKAGYTGRELASHLGIHEQTLYNRVLEEFGINFSDYAVRHYSTGEGMIKLHQFNNAMKGNNQMLIYLGKVRLKQVEARPEPDNDKPPMEAILLLEDRLAKLEYENQQLKNQMQDVIKPETDPELQRSDSTI